MVSEKDPVPEMLELLREQTSEEELLNAACQIPEEIIDRDALAIVVTENSGEGSLYTSGEIDHLQHRLLELVYRHKKVICGERSVHVLPNRDMESRSFLSVPFRVMGEEAGSLIY